MIEHGKARYLDPDTAKAAALSVKVSRLESLVYEAIFGSGFVGKTLDEIVAATGIEKVSASPRLKPLVIKKLIIDSGRRQNSRAGRPMILWVAGCFANPQLNLFK